MKVTQRLLYRFFFAVFLLFAAYGCQTTNNAVTSEPPVAELTSDKTEYVEHITPQTNTVVKEASATSVTATEETDITAKKEAEAMEKFGNYLIGRLSGHGGGGDAAAEKEAVVQDKQVTDLAVKPAGTEKRPYIEIEKQLYGRWTNKLETESYDFHGDGTVIIVISGPRGNNVV